MLTFLISIFVLLIAFYFLSPVYKKYANQKPAKHPSVIQRQAFEDYVYKTMFPFKDYDCEHKREQYSGSTGSWISVTDFPGIGYRSKSDDYRFFIKTKYRSTEPSDHIVSWVTSEERFEKFKLVNNVKPVYVIIGVGGEVTAPEQLYFIPLAKINSFQLDLRAIQQYRAKNGPIGRSMLSTAVV